MSSGTMQQGGFVTAGAARPGVCPSAHLAIAGIAAPIHEYTWLQDVNVKPVSVVFTTDRPTRRPLECFP
jgi:hypothetical protein